MSDRLAEHDGDPEMFDDGLVDRIALARRSADRSSEVQTQGHLQSLRLCML